MIILLALLPMNRITLFINFQNHFIQNVHNSYHLIEYNTHKFYLNLRTLLVTKFIYTIAVVNITHLMSTL